jgi:hypothetical protein
MSSGLQFAKTCDGNLNIFGFDKALCTDQITGFFCNFLSTCIFIIALIKVLRSEYGSELSVAMISLFIFASAANSIRFMTLSLHLNPDEYFFGQTNVSTDYIFSGATTTARWLFTFKFWIVAYEMPKIFVVGAEVKNRNKVYVRLNILAIALINIPWLIICVQSSSRESFIK